MPDVNVLYAERAPITSVPLMSPKSAYLDPLIEAVLPLVADDGEGLAEGKTDADVVKALIPLIGSFTVEDAMYLYAAASVGLVTIENLNTHRPWYALFMARSILEDFGSHGGASSAECVAARANLATAKRHEDEAEDFNDEAIRDMTSSDIRDLRTNTFSGDRFDGARFPGDEVDLPRWFEEKERRFAVWKARS